MYAIIGVVLAVLVLIVFSLYFLLSLTKGYDVDIGIGFDEEFKDIVSKNSNTLEDKK